MFIARFKARLGKSVARILRKHSIVHIDEFTRPYIIEKKVEGVTFLFHIRDQHSRLWYDLYSTDPVWNEMRFIRDHLISPGDTVIECGSHHGCTAILMSHWVGKQGKVYAYEPGLQNFLTLKDNIALNKIKNVIPINKAVGDSNSVVSFTEYADASMGSRVSVTGDSTEVKRRKSYEIDQVALDVHFDDKPALIKIDTQGYVYQPVQGAEKIIRELKPHLALEIDARSSIEQYGNNFNAIFELIQQEDYQYYAQYTSDEQPQCMPIKEIIDTWKNKNNFKNEIHLFAKNKKW